MADMESLSGCVEVNRATRSIGAQANWLFSCPGIPLSNRRKSGHPPKPAGKFRSGEFQMNHTAMDGVY